MKKAEINPKDIFAAALNISRSDLDEDTKNAYCKLLRHSQKTSLIFFSIAVTSISLAVTLSAESAAGIELVLIIALGPPVTYLYARYVDLQRKIIKIMEMKQFANHSMHDVSEKAAKID